MIAHNQPWISPADRCAVDAVLASGWIAQGPKAAALENYFVRRFGGGAACAASSGSAALFLSLHALGLGRGSRVAVPSYACTALLNAVYLAGGTPVVVDILPDTPLIDPARVPKAADAVIAVHTFGALADIDALASMGPPVIEDSCHTIEASKSTKAATRIFSFYASKPVAGGHGGLLWSKSKRIAERARDYCNYDMPETYSPRFNFQLSDVLAALALSQLRRLPAMLAKRKAIAKRYDRALPAGMARYGAGPANYRYVVRAPSEKIRDKLRAHMRKRRVGCIVPIERFELLHNYLKLPSARFPNSEAASRTTLSLPIYPAMTDAEIDGVTAALKAF